LIKYDKRVDILRKRYREALRMMEALG
jgi:hypothetical protein